MGNWYGNITVATNETDAVVESVRALQRDAYVAPAGAYTVVFDSEEQSERDTILLLETLTKRFNCGALAVCIADDDVMYYLLADKGRILEEYNSNPGYDSGDDGPPKGGDVPLLTKTFGGTADQNYVRQILHEYEPMFEVDRHQRLCDALGLPQSAVGMGYNYVYQGEAKQMGVTNLISIGDAPLS
jgi:hypothetical protein